YDHHFGIVLYLFIHPMHLAFHYRANRAASCKEEVGDIYLASQVITGDYNAVLINKLEVGDGMVNGVRSLYLFFSEDGQSPGLFLDARSKEYGARQDQ